VGIEGRISAADPEPDTRLVAHVLSDWKLHNFDQFKLAEFGLMEIGSKIRCWAGDLDDGLAIELRWICFGCLYEFIYGFRDNEEQWIITRLEARDCDPRSDTIKELGYAVFVRTAKLFERLPKTPDRTINALPCDQSDLAGHRQDDALGIHSDNCLSAIRWNGSAANTPGGTAAGMDAPGLPPAAAGAAKPHEAIRRVRTERGFAPPWLPILYLRSHVPKRRLPIDDSNRRISGKTMEIDMSKTNIVVITAIARLLEHLEAADRGYDFYACDIGTHPAKRIVLPGGGIMLVGGARTDDSNNHTGANIKAAKVCGTAIDVHAIAELNLGFDFDDDDVTADDGSPRASQRRWQTGPDDAAAHIV